MAIINIFSKRQNRLKGKQIDVYSYDVIPQSFRIQVIHIINDVIGEQQYYGQRHLVREDQIFGLINRILCKEYGVFNLNGKEERKHDLLSFLLETNDIEKALDVIEVTFQFVMNEIAIDSDYSRTMRVLTTPSNAIEELNKRFQEHALGYQFEDNYIIKVDSTYIHSEIVKPTLLLLSNEKFQGAFDEYLKAHEHYRHGRNKETLAECLKAFESTLKIICDRNRWEYDAKDTASKLIKICANNGLFPDFTETQLGSLKNLLEGGVPTLRNKYGGHGQGGTVQVVDSKLSRYCLNLTGSNIIFLIEQSGIK